MKVGDLHLFRFEADAPRGIKDGYSLCVVKRIVVSLTGDNVHYIAC